MAAIVDSKKNEGEGSKSGDGTQSAKESTSSEYYWDSYAHFGIHEEMLKDEVRTRSYMNAIEQNKHLFAGKIVLDVGCGTGILSMFAARAGARKVYAVECSNIVTQCRQIVKDNKLDDVIEVLQGKMEDITLPVEKVDIIISEWMGYFLLYESMLDTVLYARDKYLKRDTGVIMPDKAVLYIAAIEDGEYKNDKIDFWDNVYGFDMSTIKNIAMTEPLVDVVDPKTIISNFKPILNLDLLTCTVEDLSFEADFKLKFTRNDFCHALVGFFECAFTQVHKPIIFSEELEGGVVCKPNDRNPRDLDINFTTKFEGRYMNSEKTFLYRLR